MCGLWGVTSNWLSPTEIDAVVDLAAISSVRGKDSTGIAVVIEDKKSDTPVCRTFTEVSNPVTFFQGDDTIPDLVQQKPCVIMGHNRAATIGAINLRNAHPISEGSIVGCHNGTISRFKPVKDKETETSDSRVFMKLINELGIKEAVKEAGDGAFALSYINKKEGTINFIRNDQRPFYFMHTKGHATMFWASQAWMLAALDEITWMTFDKPVESQPYSLYTFELGRTHFTLTKIDRPRYKSYIQSAWEEYFEQAYEPPKTVADLFKDKEELPLSLPKGPTSAVPIILRNTGGPHNIRPAAWYCGYNNTYVSIHKAQELLENTECTLCTLNSTIFDTVWWHRHDAYVCDSCKSDFDEMTQETLHEGHLKNNG